VPNSDKLPVFRTISHAYGFAFRNLPTIIGLIWLPLVLLAGAAYFVALQLLAIFERLSSSDVTAIDELQRTGFIFYDFVFGIVFLYAVMLVPVMRQALGLRTGGAIVHFGLGAAALRTFAALFLLYLLVMTVSIVSLYALVLLVFLAATGGAAIAAVTGISPAVATGAGGIAAAVVYFGATTYVNVRLSFFVVALTVAENRIDLLRAWNLTHGIFWRIFWILFAIRAPLTIIGSTFAVLVLGLLLRTGVMSAGSHVAAAKDAAASLEAIRHLLPVIFGIALFFEPLRLGLEAGAAAASYRAVVPPIAPSAVDSAAKDSGAGDLRANDLAQATAAS
jgi:hypothetical protein